MSAQHTPGTIVSAAGGSGVAIGQLTNAAPDLLVCVKTLLALLPLLSPEDILGPDSSLVADMRMAVAKATGSAS